MEKILPNFHQQDRVKEGISFVPQTKMYCRYDSRRKLEMGAFLVLDDYRSTIDEIYSCFQYLEKKKSISWRTLRRPKTTGCVRPRFND